MQLAKMFPELADAAEKALARDEQRYLLTVVEATDTRTYQVHRMTRRDMDNRNRQEAGRWLEGRHTRPVEAAGLASAKVRLVKKV